MHHQSAMHTVRTGSTPAGTGAADILSLMATPSFAIMALLTPMLDRGADVLCAASTDAMPVNGMVVMYALMAGFHLPCWLRLIAGRRRIVQPRVGSSET